MRPAIPDIEPHLAHAPAGEPVPFDALDLSACGDAQAGAIDVNGARE